MKKAKIALTAMILLIVTGGSLAFKASRIPHKFYLTNVLNGHCSIATVKFFVPTVVVGPKAFTIKLGTAPTTDPCPVILIRSDN